jgi:hypothetical protein
VFLSENGFTAVLSVCVGVSAREDKIWGIFRADDQTQHLWNLKQSVLENHGLKTDIVYEDPEYPLTSEYQNIIHWSQEE